MALAWLKHCVSQATAPQQRMQSDWPLLACMLSLRVMQSFRNKPLDRRAHAILIMEFLEVQSFYIFAQGDHSGADHAEGTRRRRGVVAAAARKKPQIRSRWKREAAAGSSGARCRGARRLLLRAAGALFNVRVASAGGAAAARVLSCHHGVPHRCDIFYMSPRRSLLLASSNPSDVK